MRRKWITRKEEEQIRRQPPNVKAVSFTSCGILLIVIGIIIYITIPVIDITGMIMIGLGVLTLILGIVYCVIAFSDKAERLHNEEILSRSNIFQVDSMSGATFEKFLATLFKKRGYSVELTKKTGDYGVDLILRNGPQKIIVQAKRYNKKVSIDAVQQISAAKNYYMASEAWVVTNNYFTQPAKNLAQSNNVRLIERNELASLMCSTDISVQQFTIQPEFNVTNIENPKNETVSAKAKTTDSLLKYEDIVSKETDYNLWYRRNLFAIKNKILDIYPSFNYDEIKKLIEQAENYKPKDEQDLTTLHYFYNDVISIVYALRYSDPTAENYCLQLCDKDIEILKQIKAKDISVIAITRKAITYEKEGKIEEALELCDLAIANNYLDNGKLFSKRKERLFKKLNSNYGKLHTT